MLGFALIASGMLCLGKGLSFHRKIIQGHRLEQHKMLGVERQLRDQIETEIVKLEFVMRNPKFTPERRQRTILQIWALEQQLLDNGTSS